jgi:tRNA(Arg) A34 adenosine deaminase TadA
MEQTLVFLRRAMAAAKESKEKGNLPFGCILVDPSGEVLLKGENTVISSGDCLAHAEINLIREASWSYSHTFLTTCTIYTSDEPCPMCASAIYWSGIGRLVYGISKKRFYDIVGRQDANFHFEIPCREIFERGGRKVEVIGPLLEDEMAVLHKTED